MATEAQAPAAREPSMATLLCQLAETYGRGICREPQRVAAMLRDLCPERRRESFLLVSALKENVVADLLGSLDAVPEEILVARGARKLRDNLGLAEDSARWAVDSWFPACRILAAAPELPPGFRGGASVTAAGAETASGAVAARARPVDWAWLAWCTVAVACAGLSLATVVWVAFWHSWSSFGGWLAEISELAAGLGVAGTGLAVVAGRLRSRAAPNHRVLDPNRAAGAMLAEVATLLSLPLAPVLAVALWRPNGSGS